MLVILDSNIIISDFYLKKPNLQLLRKFGRVILPEIVCDEVLNKYKERLRESKSVMLKKIDEYNSLTIEACQINNYKSVEEEVEEYEKFLTNFMIEMGSYPPERYPEIPHKQVVERALNRKKPFKADGKEGYRDYLLWKSVLCIFKTYKLEEIHFISENISDFADPTDRSKLHEQLVEDIKDLGEDEKRLVFWPCLRDFIDKVVKPYMTSVRKKEELINQLLGDKEGFVKPIELFLERTLKNYNVQGSEIFVPGYCQVIFSIDQMDDLFIEEISNIENGEMFIEGHAHYYSVIKSEEVLSEILKMPKSMLEESQIEVKEDNHVNIFTELLIDVGLRILYSHDKEKIISIEIVGVRDSSYCEYCPYD